MTQTVYVGMSGGVDSSVTAALMKEQGFNVIGVYMKNWTQDLPGFECPWRDDLADAKRVAVQLGIKLEVFDFQEQYKDKVVDYMLDAYRTGITPNPDIMCNQEIKFKIFLEASIEAGADFIATGHYARTQDGKLLQAKDDNKDQTYFLYRVEEDALKRTKFPLGDYTKQEVREMAEERGLATAKKKESMGICFVGKVGVKDFLSQYIDSQPGDIIDVDGNIVGQHEGAIFYTIGQRHGLNVGGGLPFYVVAKDMAQNTVTVTSDIDDDRLWVSQANLTSFHAINNPPVVGKTYQARSRHRAPLVPIKLTSYNSGEAQLEFIDPTRAITPGQSIVLYEDDRVLGGGIISSNK